MSVNGVIVSKLASMHDTLGQLRQNLPPALEAYSQDWAAQRMRERALQIAIEAMIDIGERLVALTGGPPCETASGVFDRLQRVGILKDADRSGAIVRFRNFLVHPYDRVDHAIVYEIATHRLGDLEAFAAEVQDYCAHH